MNNKGADYTCLPRMARRENIGATEKKRTL